METGVNGVTKNTPNRILFGAGTIHKGLSYDSSTSTWNFDASVIGATNGGSKLAIIPEIAPIAIDGVTVAVKELTQKTGEKATMDINMAELTPDLIKASTLGTSGTSTDSNYDLIESKSVISPGDYFDNIAFVGRTLNGKKVIAILDNALCTSGFSNEGKNKEGAVGAYTFECHASVSDTDLGKLPWHIYWPKDTTGEEE